MTILSSYLAPKCMFSPLCSISSMERPISEQSTTFRLRFWISSIRPPLKKSYPNSTAHTTTLQSRRLNLSSSRSETKQNTSILQCDSRQSFLICQTSVIDFNKCRLLQSVFSQIHLITAFLNLSSHKTKSCSWNLVVHIHRCELFLFLTR